MSDMDQVAERRSIFDGHDIALTRQSGDNLTINVAEPALRFALRMDASAAAQVQPAGFDVSQPINCMRQSSGANGKSSRMSMRLGPDEWLLVAAREGNPAETLMTHVASDLVNATHTLVDVSHRNVAIELTGTAAADVLNTGCPLDLGQQAFPVGTATRTLFAKAEIVLCRLPDIATGDRGQQPHYRVECWRSFGRYMLEHLQDSADLIGVC